MKRHLGKKILSYTLAATLALTPSFVPASAFAAKTSNKETTKTTGKAKLRGQEVKPVFDGSTISIVNNNDTSDTISFSSVKKGDFITVKKSGSTGFLQTADIDKDSSPSDPFVMEFEDLPPSGNLIFTRVPADSDDKDPTQTITLAIPAIAQTNAPSADNITVKDNANKIKDTVIITDVPARTTVTTYEGSTTTKLATGLNASNSVGTVTISMPKDITGLAGTGVGVTFKSPEQSESVKVTKTFTAVGTSTSPLVANFVATNQIAGKDTVAVVNGGTPVGTGVKINVYDGTGADKKLYGYLTKGSTLELPVTTFDNETNVYLTSTEPGKNESDPPVALKISDADKATRAISQIITNNHAPLADKVVVKGLKKGDKVSLYNFTTKQTQANSADLDKGILIGSMTATVVKGSSSDYEANFNLVSGVLSDVTVSHLVVKVEATGLLAYTSASTSAPKATDTSNDTPDLAAVIPSIIFNKATGLYSISVPAVVAAKGYTLNVYDEKLVGATPGTTAFVASRLMTDKATTVALPGQYGLLGNDALASGRTLRVALQLPGKNETKSKKDVTEKPDPTITQPNGTRAAFKVVNNGRLTNNATVTITGLPVETGITSTVTFYKDPDYKVRAGTSKSTKTDTTTATLTADSGTTLYTLVTFKNSKGFLYPSKGKAVSVSQPTNNGQTTEIGTDASDDFASPDPTFVFNKAKGLYTVSLSPVPASKDATVRIYKLESGIYELITSRVLTGQALSLALPNYYGMMGNTTTTGKIVAKYQKGGKAESSDEELKASTIVPNSIDLTNTAVAVYNSAAAKNNVTLKAVGIPVESGVTTTVTYYTDKNLTKAAGKASTKTDTVSLVTTASATDELYAVFVQKDASGNRLPTLYTKKIVVPNLYGSASIKASDVTVVNTGGRADKVVVKNVIPGSTVNVYKDAKLTSTRIGYVNSKSNIAEVTNFTADTINGVLSPIKDGVGDAGKIYVSLTYFDNGKYTESQRTEVLFKAEQRSDIGSATISSAVASDVVGEVAVTVDGVKSKDVITVYKKNTTTSPTSYTVVAVATANVTGSMKIDIPTGLAKKDIVAVNSGDVLVATATTPGKTLSLYTADFTVVASSKTPDIKAVDISTTYTKNNLGSLDVFGIGPYPIGTVVEVYSATGGASANLIGSGTATSNTSVLQISLAYPDKKTLAEASVFVYAKQPGKAKSSEYTYQYPVEPTTGTPVVASATQSANTSVEVSISGLTVGALIDVYKSNGTVTDSTKLVTTRTAADTTMTITVPAGKLLTSDYVVVKATEKGKLESLDSAAVQVAAITGTPAAGGTLVVTRTLGSATTDRDKVVVTNGSTVLPVGTIVNLYQDDDNSPTLGSDTLIASKRLTSELVGAGTVTFNVVLTDAKFVYSTFMEPKKAEGAVSASSVATGTTAAVELPAIPVAVNGAGKKDTLTVTDKATAVIADGDKINVYKGIGDSNDELIYTYTATGSGANAIHNVIAVDTLDFGSVASTIQVTLQAAGKKESKKVAVQVPAGPDVSTTPLASQLSYSADTTKFTVAADAPKGLYRIYVNGSASANAVTITKDSTDAVSSIAVTSGPANGNATQIQYTFEDLASSKGESAKIPDGFVPLAPTATDLAFNATTKKFTIASAAPTGTYKIFFGTATVGDEITVSHVSGTETTSGVVKSTLKATDAIKYTYTNIDGNESAKTTDGAVVAALVKAETDKLAYNNFDKKMYASAALGGAAADKVVLYTGTTGALSKTDVTLLGNASAGASANKLSAALSAGTDVIAYAVLDSNGNTSLPSAEESVPAIPDATTLAYNNAEKKLYNNGLTAFTLPTGNTIQFYAGTTDTDMALQINSTPVLLTATQAAGTGSALALGTALAANSRIAFVQVDKNGNTSTSSAIEYVPAAPSANDLAKLSFSNVDFKIRNSNSLAPLGLTANDKFVLYKGATTTLAKAKNGSSFITLAGNAQAGASSTMGLTSALVAGTDKLAFSVEDANGNISILSAEEDVPAAPVATKLSYDADKSKFTAAATTVNGTYKIYFGSGVADKTMLAVTSASAFTSEALVAPGAVGSAIKYTILNATGNESTITADGTVPVAPTALITDITTDSKVTMKWTIGNNALTPKVAYKITATNTGNLTEGELLSGVVLSSLVAGDEETTEIAFASDNFINWFAYSTDANGNTSKIAFSTPTQESAPLISTLANSTTTGVSTITAVDGDKIKVGATDWYTVAAGLGAKIESLVSGGSAYADFTLIFNATTNNVDSIKIIGGGAVINTDFTGIPVTLNNAAATLEVGASGKVGAITVTTAAATGTITLADGSVTGAISVAAPTALSTTGVTSPVVTTTGSGTIAILGVTVTGASMTLQQTNTNKVVAGGTNPVIAVGAGAASVIVELGADTSGAITNASATTKFVTGAYKITHASGIATTTDVYLDMSGAATNNTGIVAAVAKVTAASGNVVTVKYPVIATASGTTVTFDNSSAGTGYKFSATNTIPYTSGSGSNEHVYTAGAAQGITIVVAAN